MNFRFRNLAVLWLLVMSTAVLFGRSDVIHFKGVLLRVESGASPKIVVRVATAELSLAVSSDTVIEASGNHNLTLADLSVGQFLELEAAFTAQGLFVKKIELEKDPENHFRVDGLVDAVEKVSGETKLTVIGIPFWLNADTRIHAVGRDPKSLAASDLKPGDRVDVQGVQEGGRLVARRLTVGFPKAEDHPIRFEGLIEKISSDGKTLELKVGDVGRAVVHLTSATKVIGTPKVGLLAQVSGFLESDLSVVALSVRVDSNRNGNVDDDEEDDDDDDEPYRLEITLVPPTTASSEAHGSASVMANPSGETFNVKAEHLEKRVSYQIVVTSTVGAHTFLAESNGGGHLRFSAKSPWPSTLVSVKSFKKVEIVRLGVVVLSGTF